MAIRRSDHRRLARLAGTRIWAERHAAERRVELSRCLTFYRRVALLLAVEKVDPESTCIVRKLRETEAALAAIPATPELDGADEECLAHWDASGIDDWQPEPRYRPPPSEANAPCRWSGTG